VSTEVYWYHANGDGTADRYPDSQELCRLIDRDGRNWFISPEGAIRHGGVIATAFELTLEPLFDAKRWFHTGKLDPAGKRVVLKITEAVHIK